jgi:hypothetical protein
MPNEIVYTDAPPDVEEALRDPKFITDFLPPPEVLRTYGVHIIREEPEVYPAPSVTPTPKKPAPLNVVSRRVVAAPM